MTGSMHLAFNGARERTHVTHISVSAFPRASCVQVVHVRFTHPQFSKLRWSRWRHCAVNCACEVQHTQLQCCLAQTPGNWVRLDLVPSYDATVLAVNAVCTCTSTAPGNALGRSEMTFWLEKSPKLSTHHRVFIFKDKRNHSEPRWKCTNVRIKKHNTSNVKRGSRI